VNTGVQNDPVSVRVWVRLGYKGLSLERTLAIAGTSQAEVAVDAHASVIGIFMAALRSRCGHYIFILWFLLSFYLLSFPRLISGVADWMSTILQHMVWP